MIFCEFNDALSPTHVCYLILFHYFIKLTTLSHLTCMLRLTPHVSLSSQQLALKTYKREGNSLIFVTSSGGLYRKHIKEREKVSNICNKLGRLYRKHIRDGLVWLYSIRLYRRYNSLMTLLRHIFCHVRFRCIIQTIWNLKSWFVQTILNLKWFNQTI